MDQSYSLPQSALNKRRVGIEPAPEESEAAHTIGRLDAVRIALVAIAIVAVRLPLPHRLVAMIGIGGIAISGWPIFREAAENLLARRMTMELSMSIAVAAAAAISEFSTALIITLFVLVAEVLENITVSRGRKAIRDMMDFLPRIVTVRRAGSVTETSVDELRPGDSILINPGALIAVDGIVIDGHSFVDQSRITGESLAVEKLAGA